mgnify:CR=1 FL=1
MEFVYSARNPQARVAYASFGAMHTVLETVLVGLPEPEAGRLSEEIERLVLALDARLNRHDAGSLFARINASQGREAVALDEETFVLLQLCEVFRMSTDGYFDIAALSPGGTVPAYRLDPAARSVTLAGADIVLDAGGFGKGYALDRVRKLLADAGVANALVNFGDSSVAAVGSHPFGDCWQVTAKAGGGTFRLKEASLSLSGLRPAVSDSVVVAVEGRSAFVCEILSTALYAAPAGARQGIAAEFEGYRHTEIKQHTESWTEENL